MNFSKTWKTACFQGRTLRRATGLGSLDADFYDAETHEDFWLSGPERDRSDTRYGPEAPTVEDDAADAYRAFLHGAPLPDSVPDSVR
ncbi:hypothetical protein [Streptomyces sclerotialus]|uniref:hypothetical protein n=1 Tax=Streptomyces sclerotialus TaxID=1957 RepID=UPI0034A18714